MQKPPNMPIREMQDPEIIAASEILDDAISKFNEILINMKDK
jgi:hypothetical protein